VSERRNWPVRLSPFLRDLALTAATSLLTIAALIVFGRILASRLDPEGFGAVMLARRIVATLDPLSTFAMAIAVTRFAALMGVADRHRVLVVGTAIGLGAGAIIAAIWFGFAAAIADVVFESANYVAMVRATAAVIAAYSVFIVVYAWYRGTDRMWQANLWQIWAIAIGPVVVVWLTARPGNEPQVLIGLAVVLLLAAVPLAAELVVALKKSQPLGRTACGRLRGMRLRVSREGSHSEHCSQSALLWRPGSPQSRLLVTWPPVRRFCGSSKVRLRPSGAWRSRKSRSWWLLANTSC
jgi:O-antigen/teichoic acid export membrane protein